jgi:hypothetical protein
MQRRGYQAPDPTTQAQKQEQLERSGTGCAWPRARRRRRQINLLEVKTWLLISDAVEHSFHVEQMFHTSGVHDVERSATNVSQWQVLELRG